MLFILLYYKEFKINKVEVTSVYDYGGDEIYI